MSLSPVDCTVYKEEKFSEARIPRGKHLALRVLGVGSGDEVVAILNS